MRGVTVDQGEGLEEGGEESQGEGRRKGRGTGVTLGRSSRHRVLIFSLTVGSAPHSARRGCERKKYATHTSSTLQERTV